MSGLEHVAAARDFEPGARLSLVVDDTPVLLFRIGDQFYAIEDLCTHDGQPLADGPLEGTEIKCPRHGARFDVRTGAALCMPATEPVTVFDVETRDGEVYVGPAGALQQPAPGGSTDVITSPMSPAPHETASVESEGATTAESSQGPDDLSLIDALRQVIDPELMINIVDLGLVYSVGRSDTKVNVDMTLTSPACPAGPQIVQQAKMALERLDGVEEAGITLTMTPPWSPDEARDQLGIF